MVAVVGYIRLCIFLKYKDILIWLALLFVGFI